MPENFIRLLFPLFVAGIPDWYAEVSHYNMNGREQYNVVIFRRVNGVWDIYDSIGAPMSATQGELSDKAKDLIETYSVIA